MEQAGGARQTFDLSGGALCLDFANTLDHRPDPRPNELLESYADLLSFAQQSDALPEAHLERLHAEATRRPADADLALTRALDLREAIYPLFLALAEGRRVQGADLAALNRALAEALAQARVVAQAPRGFAWAWADDPPNLDAPLWPVARSAADLLTSPPLEALRVCASERCDWLFLDTSRNGSRRWCSMRTCGNRAKARRHHARARAASTSIADA